HWVQLSWPGVQLVGASLPGIPLVASGASGHLAWGLTNSYVDVADAVLVPEAGLKTRSVRPLVWVKKWGLKWPIFFKTFQILEGTDLPVLPLDSPEPGHALVLRWTGFDLTASDLSPLWQFPEARTAGEFDELLGKVGVPSWNFVFADIDGNIGYRVVGRLPKRAPRSRGTLERLSQAELKSWPILSSQESPHILNPSRGWVVTANQLQWGSDGAVSVGWNHSESFRAFRIEELLRAGLKEKHSVESFQKIQCDQQAVDARFLLPVLLPHLPKNEVTERLESWNFDAGLDCHECAVFRLWMKALGDPQWTYARAMESSPEFWREASHALESAVEKLRGLPSAPWIRWGSFHRAPFPATEIPRPFPMGDLDSALPTGGDDHSVWPGSSDWMDLNGVRGFSHHSSASQRLVVEMSNPPKIHWVLPGENRGDSSERATSPAREAWAGCQLKELSGWGSAR
ncbi:MAG: penicillin acylase family protein, partial [Bdellovibrionales bacterium]|nr:penicillin acylase family protein [Bdellovibrionales bacterium]